METWMLCPSNVTKQSLLWQQLYTPVSYVTSNQQTMHVTEPVKWVDICHQPWDPVRGVPGSWLPLQFDPFLPAPWIHYTLIPTCQQYGRLSTNQACDRTSKMSWHSPPALVWNRQDSTEIINIYHEKPSGPYWMNSPFTIFLFQDSGHHYRFSTTPYTTHANHSKLTILYLS